MTTSTGSTVVFDVNETLLSLAGLRDLVEGLLGDPGATATWFARILHGSLVANHLDAPRTFEDIATSELQRLAAAAGTPISTARARTAAGRLRRLPAHDDVPEALRTLRSDGHRVVAFTNGASDAVSDQLEHAGVADLFDTVMSVDMGRVFKPHPDAYLALSRTLGTPPSELVMVAAHDWDVAGARHAGLHAVFVDRTGDSWHLPQEQGTTVTTLADLVAVL